MKESIQPISKESLRTKELVSPKFKESLKDLSFLERHLEPESMEETAKDYEGMDFRETDEAFADSIAARIPQSAYVADMGCGPGNIALLLAKKRPDLKIVGVDLSGAMLQIAESKAHEQKVSNLEAKLGDITKSVFAYGELDFVYSHTTLHHLSDLRPFFAEMKRALKPSGGFVLRDLRRPESAAQAMEWIAKATGDNLTQRQYELFFYSLRASLTFDEIQTLTQEMSIEGTLEITTNPDRYWVFSHASR